MKFWPGCGQNAWRLQWISLVWDRTTFVRFPRWCPRQKETSTELVKILASEFIQSNRESHYKKTRRRQGLVTVRTNSAVPQATVRWYSPHFLLVSEVENAFYCELLIWFSLSIHHFMYAPSCTSSIISFWNFHLFAFLFEFPTHPTGDFVLSPGVPIRQIPPSFIAVYSLTLVFPRTFTLDWLRK